MIRRKVRTGKYSMQGCSHWEETVVTENKIYFKEKPLKQHKPKEQSKKEIFSGKSIIPPRSKPT